MEKRDREKADIERHHSAKLRVFQNDKKPNHNFRCQMAPYVFLFLFSICMCWFLFSFFFFFFFFFFSTGKIFSKGCL